MIKQVQVTCTNRQCQALNQPVICPAGWDLGSGVMLMGTHACAYCGNSMDVAAAPRDPNAPTPEETSAQTAQGEGGA